MSCVPGMCDSSRSTNASYFCGAPSVPSGFTLLGQLPYATSPGGPSYYSNFLLHAYKPSAEAANMQSYDCATRVHQPYAAYPPTIPRTMIENLYQPRASRGWVGCRQ